MENSWKNVGKWKGYGKIMEHFQEMMETPKKMGKMLWENWWETVRKMVINIGKMMDNTGKVGKHLGNKFVKMIKQLGKTMEALEKMEDFGDSKHEENNWENGENKHNWAKLGDKLWKVRF